MKTLLATVAALALAALPAAACAQNVEKIGTPGGRILTGAKVKAGGEILFLSGNLGSPLTPGGSDYGDTKAQTISTLTKIKGLLEAQGYAMKDIIRMDAYLVAPEGGNGKMDFAGFNAGFAEFFGTTENTTTVTRTTMQIAGLAAPWGLVELTVVAAK